MNCLLNPYPNGQGNWRWCHKCEGLYFASHATAGKCAGGGVHEKTKSGSYRLLDFSANFSKAGGQGNWRWCHKCEGLFYAGNPFGVSKIGAGVISLNKMNIR